MFAITKNYVVKHIQAFKMSETQLELFLVPGLPELLAARGTCSLACSAHRVTGPT